MFPWGAIATLLYKVADWLWHRHEANVKVAGEPLTDAEENSDITNLPRK